MHPVNYLAGIRPLIYTKSKGNVPIYAGSATLRNGQRLALLNMKVSPQGRMKVNSIKHRTAYRHVCQTLCWVSPFSPRQSDTAIRWAHHTH